MGKNREERSFEIKHWPFTRQLTHIANFAGSAGFYCLLMSAYYTKVYFEGSLVFYMLLFFTYQEHR